MAKQSALIQKLVDDLVPVKVQNPNRILFQVCGVMTAFFLLLLNANDYVNFVGKHEVTIGMYFIFSLIGFGLAGMTAFPTHDHQNHIVNLGIVTYRRLGRSKGGGRASGKGKESELHGEFR